MTTYRKQLKNRAGDNIVPAFDGSLQIEDFDPSIMEQFGTSYTGTRCSVRKFVFGKVGFIVGESTQYTWSGTYSAQTSILPVGIMPSGTVALGVMTTTTSHTVDDNQWTHGASGFNFGTTAITLSWALLSTNSASKSCKVFFIIPCKLP